MGQLFRGDFDTQEGEGYRDLAGGSTLSPKKRGKGHGVRKGMSNLEGANPLNSQEEAP